MILKQYYLAAWPRFLSARRRGQRNRIVVDPSAISSSTWPMPGNSASDPARIPDPFSRRLRRRPSGTARPVRRHDPSGFRARAEYAFVGMKDGDSLEFPGCASKFSKRPAIRSSPFRSWSSISRNPPQDRTLFLRETPCLSETSAVPTYGRRSVGQLRTRSAPLRLRAQPAHAASRRDAGLSHSRRRFPLWKAAFLRYSLLPRRSAAFELRPAAHVERAIHLLVTADQPDAPAYFTYDAILNTRERVTLDENLEKVLHPIDLDEVLRMGTRARRSSMFGMPPTMPRGTWRAVSTSAEWAIRHLGGHRAGPRQADRDHRGAGPRRGGSVTIGPYRFRSREGYCERDGIARRPARSGMDNRARQRRTVAEELSGADPPLVLDIRSPREWAAKHIDGSVNIPLNHLQERIGEVPETAALPSIAPAGTALRSPPAFCINMADAVDRNGWRPRCLGGRPTSGGSQA